MAKKAQGPGTGLESSEAISARLDALEKNLDRLRAMYESYFLGLDKRPPEVPRGDLNRAILETQQISIRNSALRFRFQTIQQRWITYVNHWNRTLREIENGTYRRDVARAQRRIASRGEALTAQEAIVLGIPAAQAHTFPDGHEDREAKANAYASESGEAAANADAAETTQTSPSTDAAETTQQTSPSAEAAETTQQTSPSAEAAETTQQTSQEDESSHAWASPPLPPPLSSPASPVAPPPATSSSRTPPPFVPSSPRSPAAPPPIPAVAAAAAERGSTPAQKISDEELGGLITRWRAAAHKLGKPDNAPDAPKLRQQLETQLEKIARERGVQKVQFDVATKDGKVVIRVKKAE